MTAELNVRFGIEPLLAALVTGWTIAALPFFPAAFVPGLAGLAALLTAWRARLGVAFTLAVPILPLGNHSLALALVYAAVALAWLCSFWREPKSALSFALGPSFALVSALALVPLALYSIRSPLRRALAGLGALTTAALVAGIRGSPLPPTGEAAPTGLGLARSESITATAGALWRTFADYPQLVAVGLVLAVAAAALPFAARFGNWGIAAFGALLLAALLLPAPAVAALPVVLCAWATCAILAARAPGTAG